VHQVDIVPIHTVPILVVSQQNMAVSGVIVADSHRGTAPYLLLAVGQTLVAVERPNIFKRDISPLGDAAEFLNEMGKGPLAVR
jgi:hypothetical protein